MKGEAPTGLSAKRTDDNTGKLTWDEVKTKKDKDITYNVYRQIESGDVQKIAGGVEKQNTLIKMQIRHWVRSDIRYQQ